MTEEDSQTLRFYLAAINEGIRLLDEKIRGGGLLFVDVEALRLARDSALKVVPQLATTYITDANRAAWTELAVSTYENVKRALETAGHYSYGGVAGQVAENFVETAGDVAKETASAVKTGVGIGSAAVVLLVGAVILLKVL